MTENMALNIGANVTTSDGKSLGKVKEVMGECFKLDAPMQPDYWLGKDAVSTVLPDGVHLSITADNLLDEVKSEIRQRDLSHSGFHRH